MGRGSFTSFYISFLFLKQMNKHLDIGVRGLGHHTHFPGLVTGKRGRDHHLPLEMCWVWGTPQSKWTFQPIWPELGSETWACPLTSSPWAPWSWASWG